MKKQLAEETSLLLIRVNAELDRQLARIREQCPDEQVKVLRRGFGRVMGHLLTDVLRVIYAEHPKLVPQQLGGPYEVDMAALLGDSGVSNKPVQPTRAAQSNRKRVPSRRGPRG